MSTDQDTTDDQVAWLHYFAQEEEQLFLGFALIPVTLDPAQLRSLERSIDDLLEQEGSHCGLIEVDRVWELAPGLYRVSVSFASFDACTGVTSIGKDDFFVEMNITHSQVEDVRFSTIGAK